MKENKNIDLGETPLNWIKKNSKIFLDQNIPPDVKTKMNEDGYKNVFDVVSLGYIGARDSKLLSMVKERRMILVTFDRKFHKQAFKYNSKMSILIKHKAIDGKPAYISTKTIKNRIQCYLNDNFKEILEYIMN